MAEEVQTAQPVDPYDIGDTGLHFTKEIPDPPETPAVAEPRRNAAGRLVDEHGKFIKATATEETPAPAPQEPASPEPTPETRAAASHPAWLVQQANEFGLDEEDLAQPTNILAKQVNRLLRQQSQFKSEVAAAWDMSRAQVKEPAPKVETAAPVDDLGIDENELSPTLVQVLKSLKRDQAALKKENEELKSGLGQVRNFQEQRINESRTEWIDRLFENSKRPELFGQGSIRDLADTAPETIRRSAVIEMAKRLAGSKASAREQIQKIPEAIKLLHGEPVAPAAVDPKVKPTNGAAKPRFTDEQWQESILAPSTHRSGAPELKGEAKAIARLEEKYGRPSTRATDEEDMDTLL